MKGRGGKEEGEEGADLALMNNRHSNNSTACCLLHTINCTLYTAHYELHTTNFTLHTAHYKLHTINCTLYTAKFTLQSSHCKSVQYTLQGDDSVCHREGAGGPVAPEALAGNSVDTELILYTLH